MEREGREAGRERGRKDENEVLLLVKETKAGSRDCYAPSKKSDKFFLLLVSHLRLSQRRNDPVVG